MNTIPATNARSSGVTIDPMKLRNLMTLKDGPGVLHFVSWLFLLAACGYGVHLSLDTYWIIPAMIVYAAVLREPSYAISHESAHGTYVKSKWLNAVIFWFTSAIYFENPVHRYHAHMRHHNFTWINGVDSQIIRNPMYLHTFLLEFSNLEHLWYNICQFLKTACGYFDPFVRSFVPEQALPRLQRASLIYVVLYASMPALAWWFNAWDILLIYFVVPLVFGGFTLQAFVISQHVEMEADQHDIRKSCRSFDSNWIIRYLGCDMNRHVEHHLYPKIPFHALDQLRDELGDQLPPPDRGMLAANCGAFLPPSGTAPSIIGRYQSATHRD